MIKSKEALKIVIKGETEAVATYKEFANIAEKEGYKNISILFKALIKAEYIHIKNHRNALGEGFTPDIDTDIKTGSTLDNIQAAIIGETEENKKLYPSLIKSIKKELNSEYGKVTRLSLLWASKAEKEHANHLKSALAALKEGKDLEFDAIYICDVCGNVVFDSDANKECEICGHDIIFFKRLKSGE